MHLASIAPFGAVRGRTRLHRDGRADEPSKTSPGFSPSSGAGPCAPSSRATARSTSFWAMACSPSSARSARSMEPARSALRCIEDILAAIDAWSPTRRPAAKLQARITIGGHFGEAFVGILGTDDMLEFTAIGDTVNVAQRLQRVAADSGWKVVVSEELRAAAGVPFAADQWSEITASRDRQVEADPRLGRRGAGGIRAEGHSGPAYWLAEFVGFEGIGRSNRLVLPSSELVLPRAAHLMIQYNAPCTSLRSLQLAVLREPRS